MAKQIKIWARVVRGLEWLVAAEASQLPDASAIEFAHRDVLFVCSDPMGALTLRCADDVYAIWFELSNIDHTRAALSELTAAVARVNKTAPIQLAPSARHLRVTASFVGRRNYSRFEIEDAIGSILAKRLGLAYAPTATETNEDAAWCRIHLFEKSARVGLRISHSPLHRRPWRIKSTPGALHPPIAAAMAMLADYASGQHVYDPFVGSGTLLIESSLTCAGLSLEGADVSAEAVANANANARLAGVDVKLHVADAGTLAPQKADRVISNPPWGVTVDPQGRLARQAITPFLLGLVKPKGRAIFIGDRDLDLPARTREAGVEPQLVVSVRASGRFADIVVSGGEHQFGRTPFASTLSKYWSRHLP